MIKEDSGFEKGHVDLPDLGDSDLNDIISRLIDADPAFMAKVNVIKGKILNNITSYSESIGDYDKALQTTIKNRKKAEKDLEKQTKARSEIMDELIDIERRSLANATDALKNSIDDDIADLKKQQADALRMHIDSIKATGGIKKQTITTGSITMAPAVGVKGGKGGNVGGGISPTFEKYIRKKYLSFNKHLANVVHLLSVSGGVGGEGGDLSIDKKGKISGGGFSAKDSGVLASINNRFGILNNLIGKGGGEGDLNGGGFTPNDSKNLNIIKNKIGDLLKGGGFGGMTAMFTKIETEFNDGDDEEKGGDEGVFDDKPKSVILDSFGVVAIKQLVDVMGKGGASTPKLPKIDTGGGKEADTGGIMGTVSSKMMGNMIPGAPGFVKKLGAVKGLAGPIGFLIAGIVWMVFDGIKGFFRADKWGVGKTNAVVSSVLGGTDSGMKGAFKGAGKWGLIGAGIGSLVAPGVGTLVGGLIGAIVGAILGWIGGERIAKAFKAVGEWFKAKWDQLFGGFKDGAWAGVKQLFKGMVEMWKGSMKNLWKIFTWARGLLNVINKWLFSAYKKLSGLLWKGVKAIALFPFKVWKFIFDIVVGAVADLTKLIWKGLSWLFKQAKGFVGKIGSIIWGKIKPVLDKLLNIFQPIIDKVLGIRDWILGSENFQSPISKLHFPSINRAIIQYAGTSNAQPTLYQAVESPQIG